MTDATIGPLSFRQEYFLSPTVVAVPPKETIDLVSDKYSTIILAQTVGVPVPETILVKELDDLQSIADWDFPIVVKDRFSLRWLGDKGQSGEVAYAYSRGDLQTVVRSRLDAMGDVLVQKFCDGVGIGFSCFVQNGEIFSPFQWQRIREKDPRGSGSSARKSISLAREIRSYAKSLLSQTDFQGILMVEFKKNPSNGHYSLMEINGRPWGSIQLPIHCGIDYPLQLVRWYLENVIPPKEIEYKENITCRWLLADFIHLENLWEGKPDGWPCDYPSFAKNLIKVSIPWYPGLRYDDLSLRDPLPGLVDLKNWFQSHLLRKLK